MTARLSERSGKFTIGSVCGVALTRAERLCSRALQAYEHFWRVLELQRLDVAAVPGAEFAASLPQTRLALLRPHASRAPSQTTDWREIMVRLAERVRVTCVCRC
jgi:hypothetical protein